MRKLCEWSIAAEGGPGTKTCSEGTTVTTSTLDKCTSEGAPIHCLVSLVDACVRSTNGDPCGLFSTPECADYISCALEN